MKTIIAGGRTLRLSQMQYDFLNAIHRMTPITEVVSGGASGADTDGERWALQNQIPVKHFLPDWSHGKKAGLMRNTDMATYAKTCPSGGMCILFPGGTGTDDMYRKAKAAGLKIHDFRGKEQ